MSDRLQINALERAASSDINNLQSMATRVVADLYGFDQATAFEGAVSPPRPRSFIGGLNFVGDGGDNAVLLPGFLAQLSLTHPAPPGPLDSALRLGFNRQNLPITLPVPAGGEFFLLEVQVVDVVTVSTIRDVFDVPTQTFIPTLLDKQVERQVQTQFAGGAGDPVNIPEPTGDPWVVVGSFIAPGGVPSPLSLFTQTDMRPQVNDGSQDNGPGAFGNDGVWVAAHVATLTMVGEPRSSQLVGHAEGKAFGQRLLFGAVPALSGLSPFFESGFANPPDALVHIYLCPLTAGGIPIVPRSTTFPDPLARQRGALVASLVQPNILGRTNAFPITLPVPFANFDGGVIGTNTALYITSAYTDATGVLFHPFVQTEDGTNLNADPLFLGSPAYPRASFNAAIGPGSEILAYDLRGRVPDNVKAIYLRVEGGLSGSGIVVDWSLRPVGGSLLEDGFIFDPTGVTNTVYLWVPVGGNQNNIDFLNLEFLLIPSGAGTLFFQASILGWRT